jgi:hypothetical protein
VRWVMHDPTCRPSRVPPRSDRPSDPAHRSRPRQLPHRLTTPPPRRPPITSSVMNPPQSHLPQIPNSTGGTATARTISAPPSVTRVAAQTYTPSRGRTASRTVRPKILRNGPNHRGRGACSYCCVTGCVIEFPY